MGDVSIAHKFAFKYVVQDVSLLLSLFFEYVESHASKENPYKVPETFVIVTAFAFVFRNVTVTAGSLGFVVEMDESKRMGRYEFISHYWLTWQSEHYIIDLVPIDGIFGITFPNAVIQNKKRRRFFPRGKVYPDDWGTQEKAFFDHEVSCLVEILETLMKKVPL